MIVFRSLLVQIWTEQLAVVFMVIERVAHGGAFAVGMEILICGVVLRDLGVRRCERAHPARAWS